MGCDTCVTRCLAKKTCTSRKEWAGASSPVAPVAVGVLSVSVEILLFYHKIFIRFSPDIFVRPAIDKFIPRENLTQRPVCSW